MTPLVIFLRTSEQNGPFYGCHTELARFRQLINMHEVSDFKPELHAFNESHSPVLFGEGVKLLKAYLPVWYF